MYRLSLYQNATRSNSVTAKPIKAIHASTFQASLVLNSLTLNMRQTTKAMFKIVNSGNICTILSFKNFFAIALDWYFWLIRDTISILTGIANAITADSNAIISDKKLVEGGLNTLHRH
jgi:hypothetical protein